MFNSKLKASITHLVLSAIVIGVLLAFVFLYWYPGAIANIAGLSTIVMMMVAIDLTLGPLLTFIVYKPGKRGLVFDLTIIGAFQIAAMAYATHTIYEGHPIYITYAADRFTLITANEVDPQKAKLAIFKKSKLAGPTIAYAKQPDDPKEAGKIMLDVVLTGAPDIDKRPELYDTFDKHLVDVFSKSIDPEKMLKHEATKAELMKFTDKHGHQDKFAFLPLSGQGKDVIWALDKKTGKPVDVININPWTMAVNTH